MTNKPPTTSSLSYFDALSNEWVTTFTIRHSVESLPKNTNNFFTTQEPNGLTTKAVEALSMANWLSANNTNLPTLTHKSFWNK